MSRRRRWRSRLNAMMSARSWSMNRTTAHGTHGTTASREHHCRFRPSIRSSLHSHGRKPVELDGVCLLWTGFSDVEVEAFNGGEARTFARRRIPDWQRVGSRDDMDPLYPLALGPQWIPLRSNDHDAGMRLRISRARSRTHPHLDDKVKDGRRVWLGEVMALSSLDG